MKFSKYHGLGNDYIVMTPEDLTDPSPATVRRICDRHFGVGSDGILLGPLPTTAAEFGLRIFNPDGSEAEKSGNGLRIFARYLWDEGLISDQPFTISTPGGLVTAEVDELGNEISVEMGRVSFTSSEIPVTGALREVLQEELQADGEKFVFTAATIGNPHCVILVDALDVDTVKRFGSSLEHHPLFPNRTNVQFMKVLDRSTIQIEIWERGAGYTLASGSSSSASAAVAHKLGLCDKNVKVVMPGGSLSVAIAEDFAITLVGPVTRVASGTIDSEIF